jgi:hypothetical protein
MKTSFTYLLITIFILAYGQDEKKAESQIKEVTVFLSGAQVTRAATLDLPPGTSTWVFNGISPRINEQSIQAELPETVKILAVAYRVNYLQETRKTERAAYLENEVERLNRLIREEQNAIEIYREEEAMLKANKSIGGQQQGVDVSNLRLAVDYFRTRMVEIKKLQLQNEQHLAIYKNEIQKIEDQLKELKNVKSKPIGEVIIKVTTKASVRASLKLSYLVEEASWLPSYDVRAINVQSPIRLMYKANVTQHSGEDWDQVKLTISSANPSVTGAKPILNPWVLGFNNSVASYTSAGEVLQGRLQGLTLANNEIRGRVTSSDDGKGLPGVNVVIKGSTVGTVTDANGDFSIPLTSDARSLIFSFIGMKTEEVDITGRSLVDVTMQSDVTQLSEVVVTGYGVDGFGSSPVQVRGYGSYQPRVKKTIVATPVVRQTNVEYPLDEPYTIKSDSEVRMVDMIEFEVEAVYQYYTVPKLDLDAFLIARLVSWDQYNLLEGEANLFFEGKYVGKSVLDTRNTSDTLAISLGRDKNVIVTREKLKDVTSSNLLGNQRKATFAYEIKVRNKKLYPIDIRIEDQLPVPNTKEIVVDKQEDTNAEHSEESGLLAWNRIITPGKTEKIDLRYTVKYPKYSQIVLE